MRFEGDMSVGEPGPRNEGAGTGVGARLRRALLVVNPASRNGRLGVAAAAALLRGAGLEPVEAEGGDLARALAATRDAVDCVVVGGGDGTLNAALRPLVAAGLPLGVLPLGTANDFARSVGIPLDLDAAVAVIAAGATRRVDIGDVNGHPFLNVASVGLAADLAKGLTAQRKRRFGRFSYAMTAGHLLARAAPFHATLLLGAEKAMVKTMQIAVGNGRYYGGGNAIAADARIDGGQLDLYSLEFSRIWRMALMLPSFKSGGHGAVREVRTARGDAFEIITRRPRPVNADGELLTQTPARFTQRLLALTVYVPPDLAPRSAPEATR